LQRAQLWQYVFEWYRVTVNELVSQNASLGGLDISCNTRFVHCIDVRLDRRYCSKCTDIVHMEGHLTSPVKVAACLYAEVNVRGVFWRATEGPKHSRAPSLLRIAASSKVQLPMENVRENPGPARRLHVYRLPSSLLGEWAQLLGYLPFLRSIAPPGMSAQDTVS